MDVVADYTGDLPSLNGDDRLCGYELKLWSLHQAVLIRFGVYTLFRWTRRHVPNGTRELIEWFVPEQADNAIQVAEWLRYELKPDERDDAPAKDDMPAWPGTDVSVNIALFRGIEPYMERDALEPMAREMMQRMMREIKGAKPDA